MTLTPSQRVVAKIVAQTHWIERGLPVYRGQSLAACGSYVDLKKFSTEPTCPACRQQLAIYETWEF